MTKATVFKTGAIDIGLEFGQLDPPNIFSNEFFRVCTPILTNNKENQFSFIKLLKQLDIAEEYEIMKLLLMEMSKEDLRDKRVFNYLKHNIEFTNVLKNVFILPIRPLEEYLKYMKMLRNDIIDNFVFIDITYTLDDDTFNTTDVYIADYYLGTISNDTEDQRVKEDQIKVNIESQLVNGVMLEDIKNLYKSYN